MPGYASLLAAVLILGGVQLACLGIIGQYLGRTYEESKGRPLFIIWEDTRRPTDDERGQAPADSRLVPSTPLRSR